MNRLWLILGVAVLTLVYILWSNVERNKPRVVFCNVGQGDAIYFRLPEKTDVLVDTGPSSLIMRCLDQSLPYFDRQIELVFLTHLEKDHIGGLSSLTKSYQIQHLYLPKNAETTKINVQADSIEYLEKGEQVEVGQSVFEVLFPLKNQANLANESLNDSALGLLAQVHSKQILLLSDLNAFWSEKALQGLNLHVDLFKLPHHGSKYGISRRLVMLAHPALAVLSVGQRNFYGHPHNETLRLLQSLKIPLRRTDKEGNIEILL